MFHAKYHHLSSDQPDWGEVAVLPWDAEIFGFPVADLKIEFSSGLLRDSAAIAKRMTNWACENDVELIGCAVATTEPLWRVLLPRLGFSYVDTTLTYTIARLQKVSYRPHHAPVRLATRADKAAVERVCETGFRAGRYHADGRFPLALANARYRRWLANEFARLSDSNRIYVVERSGAVVGFTHVRIEGTEAYITIGGNEPSVQGGVLPFAVFIGTVEALRDSGATRVQSKLSAGNTPMLNLAAYAGSKFSEPQNVFHWHAPNSVHLVSDEVLDR